MRAEKPEWDVRVKEWRASGMSAEAYSESRGFSASRLRIWARKLGDKGRGREVGLKLVPVTVVPPSQREAESGRGHGTGQTRVRGSMVVEWAGIRVEASPQADRGVLLEVLGVLSRAGVDR